jgi:hypothetical protein
VLISHFCWCFSSSSFAGGNIPLYDKFDFFHQLSSLVSMALRSAHARYNHEWPRASHQGYHWPPVLRIEEQLNIQNLLTRTFIYQTTYSRKGEQINCNARIQVSKVSRLC